MKRRKSLLINILVVILLIWLCCILSVKTFHWTVCEEKEPHGLEFDLFLMFCEKEKDEWFEKRFWEECTKNDKNLQPHTELLISACKEPAVRGFSDGEKLFVIEGKTDEVYFLDLRTGEKTPVPDGEQLWDEVFLSPDLVWFDGYLKPGDTGYIPHYVLDLTDGKRYELFNLSWMPLKDGKFDTQNYEYIKSAEHVYYHPRENVVIALAPNFRQNPKQNIIYFDSSLEQLLKDLGVNYELVDYSLADADVPSPTGRYVVRSDGNGIYFSGTNLPIITGTYSSSCFKSWYYDESAVVIGCGISGYLYHDSITAGVSHPIPLPVLKLFLPESTMTDAQSTAIAVLQTGVALTQTALPTATSLPPTLTPTAPIVYPTSSPIPTQTPIPILTPDAIQVERWKEYQDELIKVYLDGHIPFWGNALCEWDILGRSDLEVYVWAYCVAPDGTSESLPGVLTLQPNGSVQNVEVPLRDSSWDSTIREMFPQNVREIFSLYDSNSARIVEMKSFIQYRRSYPKIPPKSILSTIPLSTLYPP